MPGAEVAIRVLFPALFRRPMAPDAICRKLLPVGNGGFLQLLLRSKVRVKRAVRKPGSLHDFAHSHALEPSLAEKPGSFLHDPFMLGGGLFDWVAHFFCI